MDRARRRLILGLGAVAAAILAGAAFLVDQGRLRFAYPDRTQYPARGVDVSHHQGPIDWGRVASDDVAFVYVKASEGGDFRDADFGRNVRAAAGAGLPVGAYHFFTLCRDGASQAANFIAVTRGADLRMPPAIDLEYLGNCKGRMSRQQFEHELSVFIAAIGAADHPKPVLYVTREFYAAYLADGAFADRPLWLRDLFLGLSRPEGRPVAVWQYANRGRVAGIDGPVDLDVLVPPAKVPTRGRL